MKPIRHAALALLCTALPLFTGCSQDRLQGAYVLEYRELPDGATIQPPDIAGVLTYSGKYRTFNLLWKDAAGKPASISYFARYRLCGDRYTEHAIYRQSDNTPESPTATYDLSAPAGSSYVHKWGDHLEFDLPLYDEPHVTFCPCGFTARQEGAFVDHWVRVR